MSLLVGTHRTAFDMPYADSDSGAIQSHAHTCKGTPQLHACLQLPHVTCLSTLLHDETSPVPESSQSDMTCLFVSFLC